MLDTRRGASPRRAHRVAYELICGPLADDQVVRHRCDHKPCVRPTHLIAGTVQDNVNDALERGLYGTLTIQQARGIIDRSAAGEPLGSIAADLDIGLSAAAHVKYGRTWKHLTRAVAQ